MQLEQTVVALDKIEFVYAGSIVYPPGGKFGPRIQQDIQLVMLYTGDLHLSINGRMYRVTPGHVIILYPGQEEHFTFSPTEESWHRWISIHVPSWEPAPAEERPADMECYPISEDMNRLLDLMLLVQSQAASNDSIMRTFGLAALQLLPMELSREIRQREKHPAVYAALGWIHEHYAGDIALHDMASRAGVSPEHLVRLFQQYERTSPVRYLWQYRMKQAMSLLTNTGLSINEIAHRCGFKTSHHFARMIKGTTGCTASEFRQRSWGGTRNV